MQATGTLSARSLDGDSRPPHTLKCILLVTLLAAFAAHARAQSHAQTKPDGDQLGMTCAQILEMSSSDWIAKATSGGASAADVQVRAIETYGRCYDARTDRLAASLAKTGKGPRMGARGDFRDFEGAIQDFTAKALAPANDRVKTAYAALYEKQFRYGFYESYETKSAAAAAENKPASHSTAQPAAKPDEPSSPDASASQGRVVDPMTLAKNRFGELLRIMPDDRLHEIHEAFGEILGPHSANPETQLAVYRYAIFVLEPTSPTPFSPPPF